MIISPNIFYYVLIYFFLFISYTGWGALTSQLLDINFFNRKSCFSLAWIGWALSLVLIHAIHIIHPINFLVSGIFFLSGIGLFFRFNQQYRIIIVPKTQKDWAFLVLVVIFSSWVAVHAQSSPRLYDSGLYHFNAIRWLQEYPLITGLGNLHHRLAFNMNYFGYVASLNVFPPIPQGHNLANSFLLFLLATESIYALCFANSHNRLELIVKIGIIPVLLVFGFDRFLSSPTPDIGSALLRIVLFINFIIVLDRLRHQKDITSHIKLIIFLAVTAITLKLSNILYGTLLIMICSGLYLFLKRPSQERKPDKMFLFLILILISITVWVVRGVALSGCPLYPSSALCTNAEWSVPSETITREVLMIKGLRAPGKKPKAYVNTWAWLPSWIAKMKKKTGAFVYPIILAGIASLIGSFIVILPYVRRNTPQIAILSLAMIPLWGALIFWFIMAPQLRLAQPFIYLLSFAGILPFFTILPAQRVQTRIMIILVLFAINLPLIISLISYRPVPTFSSGFSSEPIKKVELETFTTKSGLNLFIPTEGDQCWDSPLPATPYPQAGLKLRGKSIEAGFTVRE